MGLIIIDASLTCPPSSVTSFRDVSLFCNVMYHHQIVVECEEPSLKDFYATWLRKYGALDYVEDILTFGEELRGLRISDEECIPPTIIIKRIIPETTWNILNRVKFHTYL